ncbi:MAG: arylsulfatase [Bacillota bacterium]
MPQNLKKPNVILIMPDDQGYGDIAAHGNPWLETPVLDELCKNSISLESFHTDPLCAPTRGGLMSGRCSFGAGVYSTLTGRYYMKPELDTMGDCFQRGGYKTGMFGKWHLGDCYPYRPHERGFDVAYSFGGGVIGEIPDYWNNDYYDDMYAVNGVPKQFSGYCTDNWFQSAKEFMKEQIDSDTPFFCYLPTNAPHGPFNVDKKYYEKYLEKGVPDERARFFGMIENIDQNIGDLFQFLKNEGIYDNTVITFFGDNGTATGCDCDEDGWLTSGYNADMRGKKGYVFEGSHRNACFITSPRGILGENRKVTGLTMQYDLLATYIDLCDLPKGEQYKDLDGVSMYEALHRGDTHLNKGRKVIVHNMQRDIPQKYKDYTVLMDDFRLIRPLTLESNPMAQGNFSAPVKLNPLCYDLSNDFKQEHDIYAENIELARKLVLFYEDWYDSRVDYAMKYSPIYLCPEEEVAITCHAWHDCYEMCFSQDHIRKGIEGNGFFPLKVQEAGDYIVELRRYPRELNLPLSGSCEFEAKTDQIFKDKAAGKVYEIEKAQLTFLDTKLELDVNPSDEKVLFTAHFPIGEYNFRSKFILKDFQSIGAYYVYFIPKAKFKQ